jgi:restriction system protein
MGRRNKSSPFEDIIEIIAKLPWWVGVALALIIYLWLNHIASEPINTTSTNIKQLGAIAGNQLWKTLATFFQYIIPGTCLIGAGISAYKNNVNGNARSVNTESDGWTSQSKHRKRKQSPYEDFVEFIALFPWWVGLVLAVIAYFWLHHIADAPVIVSVLPGQVGTAVVQSMHKGFATAGQYIVPLICLLGALFSALGRWKREQLFSVVEQSDSAGALNDMSWQEFEMLVGEAYRRKGYTVNETGGGGADGGVDLVLRKEGDKFLVQCKQWKAFKVGVTTIRELYGVMVAEGAVGGFVVTSGVFTQEAKSFAYGKSINLIDGSELTAMIRQVQPQAPTALGQSTFQNTPAASAAPDCPKCGSAMVKRTAKKGSNAGNTFWGCTNYPQCRGIVDGH